MSVTEPNPAEVMFLRLQECNARLEDEVERHQATSDQLSVAIRSSEGYRLQVAGLIAANESLRGASAELQQLRLEFPLLRQKIVNLERTVDGLEKSQAYLNEVESAASTFYTIVLDEGFSSVIAKDYFTRLGAALFALGPDEAK